MRRLLPIAAVGIVTLVIIEPYLGLDRTGSRLTVSGPAHYAILVAHIFTAAVALVLGPVQFLATVRRTGRAHRIAGRVYLLAGVLPAALTAVPVAAWSGRPLTQAGLSTAAILWLITGALAYRAARRHDYTRHREWMLRNYALTFLAVTARILVPLLLLLRLPFSGDDATPVAEVVPTLIPIGQTAGWIVNLAIAEVLIRRRRTAPSPSGAGPGAGR
ncbi:DUF2306 domain-containing protein [Actinoplanes sp. N902-109]|uniref:DUF2306 domain-containing protein n=1 Tax=Actinoplanes sp. (strain N902-109) TaxID=649831 RepID=UPI00032957C2|nr:DUF2306 domain-containing protein [Actinoplanes sp. N902-109]AGL17578.1 hypothetical protein L083_4068 [Actinoplanes sp. N902-109]